MAVLKGYQGATGYNLNQYWQEIEIFLRLFTMYRVIQVLKGGGGESEISPSLWKLESDKFRRAGFCKE